MTGRAKVGDADAMLAASDAVNAFYAAVGSRIQARRKTAGLNQSELAIAVGLERTSLSNIESGHQRSSLHMFAMIAQVLGVGIADLMPSATLPVGPLRMSSPQIIKQMRQLRDELDRTIGQLTEGDNDG